MQISTTKYCFSQIRVKLIIRDNPNLLQHFKNREDINIGSLASLGFILILALFCINYLFINLEEYSILDILIEITKKNA